MKLRDIMQPFPQTVRRDDKLIIARDIMLWGQFRHLPVLDQGKLVGVLSEGDIAAHQARTGESLASSPDDTVRMAMQPEPHTAHPDDSVTEAAGRMATERIGCLPILDKGELVGLVTTTDILAAEVRRAMTSKDGMTVSDVMTRAPITVHPDDGLLDAAGRMQTQHIRHLPVVNSDNKVVGMLSDRDVRTAVGDPTRAFDDDTSSLNDLKVGDIMSSPAITTTKDVTVKQVAQLFVSRDAGAVPVIGHDERLIGIVSYIDILRAAL